MKYREFEDAFSFERTGRYIAACNGDKRRAITLYRYNLKLSQEMFTLISCFEVTLRNRIDIRNRIAHHEPICFGRTISIDTTYALHRYSKMIKLLQWMDVDPSRLLYGFVHINNVCNKIMCI